MTNAPSTDTSDTSFTRDILYAARYYLGGRRTLFVLAAVLVLGGIALNWGWLVAAGLAPILIALLPCAVMCALGLCMHKITGDNKAGKRNSVAGNSQVQIADARNSPDSFADAAGLLDPISQRMLPAATAIASVHQGRIYYFENRANRDAFEIDPEKYLAGSQVVGQQVGTSDKPSQHSHQGHGCC